MVGTAPDITRGSRSRPSAAQKRIIDRWLQIPDKYSEADLASNLLTPLFEELGVRFDQRKIGPTIGKGLKPDLLVYEASTQAPVLAIEIKRRIPELANASERDFSALCQQHTLYRDSVGYNAPQQNGIRQYLNKDLVNPGFLAPCGLVFNGDFFQLWRRVDGLVFPLTPIQKVTKVSIPTLMQQLEYCLQNSPTALVATVWNRKGGVAKTTNTLNIGATLALEGKRVLLIDLDPQGDLTRGLGLGSTNLPNYLKPCADKLELREPDAARDILSSVIQTRTFPTSDKRNYELSILTTDRASLERFRDQEVAISTALVIKQIIHLLQRNYDYILIDISPSPDKLTEGALYSCDTVLIPSDLGGKSLHHAVHLYEETIPKMREIRARRERLHLGPWNLGIVFSNCPADAGGLETVVKAELQQKNFVGKQCQIRLKTYAQTKMAEFKSAPVVCWQSSPITKLYADLTNEIFLSHNFTDH